MIEAMFPARKQLIVFDKRFLLVSKPLDKFLTKAVVRGVRMEAWSRNRKASVAKAQKPLARD